MEEDGGRRMGEEREGGGRKEEDRKRRGGTRQRETERGYCAILSERVHVTLGAAMALAFIGLCLIVLRQKQKKF